MSGIEAPALREHLSLRQELRVAAEQNVGTAAGHVGGDGHRAFASGLRHDRASRS